MHYNRRNFLISFASALGLALCPDYLSAQSSVLALKPTAFSRGLQFVRRTLELEGYYVWCTSPIVDSTGKVHVFFSRWEERLGMGGWLKGSEIVHAIADSPVADFKILAPVLQPRGPGYWDATTCHNPFIKFFEGKYYLYYIGNTNGKTDSKRIGYAVSDSLYGPWTRSEQVLLEVGEAGEWDDHCTTNPTVVKSNDNQYYMFYKSWNTADYIAEKGTVRGNRKYGLAISESPNGPFEKYQGNPVIDFSSRGDNAQFEDAFVWQEGGTFYMIARDMGVQSHEDGLLMRSQDGKKWSAPKLAFQAVKHYVQEGPYPNYLKRLGRLERPMLLLDNKPKPQWLFGASQGGKYNTSSAMVFQSTAKSVW